MHDDTAQLLASIESTVQGLIFRSEDTYALKPLVWDVSTQGEFDISRLLKSTGNLIPIELDDFLSWQEYLEDFDRWHEFLEHAIPCRDEDEIREFYLDWEFKGIGYARTGYFEIDEANKFDRIDELLTAHLKNLRVHVVGTTSMFDLYAIGQAESGDCLGVSTTAIWTG